MAEAGDRKRADGAKANKGVTLTELVIVMGTIAVLAGMMWYVYSALMR